MHVPVTPVTVVGLRGLEPPTSRLSGVRSNHLSYKPIWILSAGLLFVSAAHGGDEEIRTPDPLLARQALSHLSYTPVSFTGRRFLSCLSFPF